jgi:hypothetical protein
MRTISLPKGEIVSVCKFLQNFRTRFNVFFRENINPKYFRENIRENIVFVGICASAKVDIHPNAKTKIFFSTPLIAAADTQVLDGW